MDSVNKRKGQEMADEMQSIFWNTALGTAEFSLLFDFLKYSPTRLTLSLYAGNSNPLRFAFYGPR